jgi:hypothetical protein
MAGLDDAASELESIARHLRQVADGQLARELTQAMRRAVTPVQAEIRDGLAARLPDRYAAVLAADLRLGVNVRTTGSEPGVSLTAQAASGKGRKLRNLDEGRLTHPVFGDREHWRTQREPSVQPGWFTGPAGDADPRVRHELEQALEGIGRKADSRGA